MSKRKGQHKKSHENSSSLESSPEDQRLNKWHKGPEGHKTGSKMASDFEKVMQKLESNLIEMKLGEERIKAHVETQIGTLAKRIEIVEEENRKLKEENTQMSYKLKTLERQQRSLNVVFTGFEFEHPQEGYEKMKTFVREKTDGKVKVSGIRTFQTMKGKKIVAACTSLEDKKELMKIKKLLRENPGSNIYINDDLSKEDSDLAFKTRNFAKQQVADGKKVGKIGVGRLLVNDEWKVYNAESEQFRESEFKSKNARILESNAMN